MSFCCWSRGIHYMSNAVTFSRTIFSFDALYLGIRYKKRGSTNRYMSFCCGWGNGLVLFTKSILFYVSTYFLILQNFWAIRFIWLFKWHEVSFYKSLKIKLNGFLKIVLTLTSSTFFFTNQVKQLSSRISLLVLSFAKCGLDTQYFYTIIV